MFIFYAKLLMRWTKFPKGKLQKETGGECNEYLNYLD